MTTDLNPHALIILILVGFALLLFTQEKTIRLETSSLLILIILVLFFSIFPFYLETGEKINPVDFFSGFGHQALIAISSLMIMGKGIDRTGVLKPLSKFITSHWSKHPKRTFLLTLLISAFLSAFLNNTPIVIILIPILIAVSLKNNFSASKILIPAGLVTIIGGMATTIGTSTNILVVAIAHDLGQLDFRMFDFVLPVILVGSVGILFLWLMSPLLLPDRSINLTTTKKRIYNAVLYITDSSKVVGSELSEIFKKTNHNISISKIRRKNNQLIIPLPTVVLKTDDCLFISGTAEHLKESEAILGGRLYNFDSNDELIEQEYVNTENDQVIAEILVTSGSILHGSSLSKTRFVQKYNIIVLAHHRLNEPDKKIKQNINDIILQPGDIILVQGTSHNLNLIKNDSRLLILDSVIDPVSSKKAPLALFIMAAVIFFAATQILPISVSALSGAGIMILTRCINWRDATRALNVQVILIIVVSLALGKALIDTGGVDYLALLFVNSMAGFPTIWILSALLFFMSIITNVVSNTTAAVIGTPVAITIAQQINAPLEPFILAVMFGANMSYATPIGYQTNLLIHSAGGYKFTDFLRIGIPLTLIMGGGFTIVLAFLYNLKF
ncbi:MAG: SLC13 family permease [Gammaproteobacteria bacterium]